MAACTCCLWLHIYITAGLAQCATSSSRCPSWAEDLHKAWGELGGFVSCWSYSELLHDLLLQLQVIAPIENTIWFKPLGWEALVILRGLAWSQYCHYIQLMANKLSPQGLMSKDMHQNPAAMVGNGRHRVTPVIFRPFAGSIYLHCTEQYLQ